MDARIMACDALAWPLSEGNRTTRGHRGIYAIDPNRSCVTRESNRLTTYIYYPQQER